MFSFLSMYSQRMSSAISTLLTEGREEKSKVSSVLMVGKRAAFDPALGGPFLAFEELQLGEAEQVGEVVGVVRGGLGGHLLALGRHRREAEGLEVMVQEHHGLGLCGFHGVAPFIWRERAGGGAQRGDGTSTMECGAGKRPGETVMRRSR